MMQMSHHAGVKAVMLPLYAANDGAADNGAGGLSPVSMARYLRETNPLNAHCFALQMQEQSAWANDAWGAYWGDVARLV